MCGMKHSRNTSKSFRRRIKTRMLASDRQRPLTISEVPVQQGRQQRRQQPQPPPRLRHQLARRRQSGPQAPTSKRSQRRRMRRRECGLEWRKLRRATTNSCGARVAETMFVCLFAHLFVCFASKGLHLRAHRPRTSLAEPRSTRPSGSVTQIRSNPSIGLGLDSGTRPAESLHVEPIG